MLGDKINSLSFHDTKGEHNYISQLYCIQYIGGIIDCFRTKSEPQWATRGQFLAVVIKYAHWS